MLDYIGGGDPSNDVIDMVIYKRDVRYHGVQPALGGQTRGVGRGARRVNLGIDHGPLVSRKFHQHLFRSAV